MIFGVVEVPEAAAVEQMHAVRLNSNFWLDVNGFTRVAIGYSPQDIAEMDVNSLLTELQFSSFGDSFSVFLRASMLKHERPRMRWAYVAGAVSERPRSMPLDGLYRLSGMNGAGLVHIDPDPRAGENPSTILRLPLWGPDGNLALTTSMEPTRFPTWLAAERARPLASYEKRFLEFTRRMQERCPERMVSTAAQLAEQSAMASEIIASMVAENEPGSGVASRESSSDNLDRPRGA